MPVQFNGTEIRELFFNGVKCNVVTFNGTDIVIAEGIFTFDSVQRLNTPEQNQSAFLNAVSDTFSAISDGTPEVQETGNQVNPNNSRFDWHLSPTEFVTQRFNCRQWVSGSSGASTDNIRLDFTMVTGSLGVPADSQTVEVYKNGSLVFAETIGTLKGLGFTVSGTVNETYWTGSNSSNPNTSQAVIVTQLGYFGPTGGRGPEPMKSWIDTLVYLGPIQVVPADIEIRIL